MATYTSTAECSLATSRQSKDFQSITNLIPCAAQAAIDGNLALRAAVAARRPTGCNMPTPAPLMRRMCGGSWNVVNEFGEGPQLRLTHTDGYIGDFMGCSIRLSGAPLRS